MIKYFLLLISITQFKQCVNSKHVEKDNLKFHYVTAQSWMGGAIGSGKGIDYNFYLSPTDSFYHFDSVWVNGFRLSLERNTELSSTDTLVLMASAFIPYAGGDTPKGYDRPKDSELAVTPCCPDAKAVIRYQWKGNKYFISTIQLKELRRILYP